MNSLQQKVLLEINLTFFKNESFSITLIAALHLIFFTFLMMDSTYKTYECISLNCKELAIGYSYSLRRTKNLMIFLLSYFLFFFFNNELFNIILIAVLHLIFFTFLMIDSTYKTYAGISLNCKQLVMGYSLRRIKNMMIFLLLLF